MLRRRVRLLAPILFLIAVLAVPWLPISADSGLLTAHFVGAGQGDSRCLHRDGALVRGGKPQARPGVG